MRLLRNRYQEVSATQKIFSEKDLFRSAAIHYVELLVSKAFAIPIEVLRSPRRGNAAVTFARHTAMYLAHVGLSFSLNEIGIAYGRDRTTVLYACRSVEDERDDSSYDGLLDILEIEIHNWKCHWRQA